jgi:hypothetical protein
VFLEEGQKFRGAWDSHHDSSDATLEGVNRHGTRFAKVLPRQTIDALHPLLHQLASQASSGKSLNPGHGGSSVRMRPCTIMARASVPRPRTGRGARVMRMPWVAPKRARSDLAATRFGRTANGE